ncbi:hypothetical protein IscW_ISCW001148 [Ixodes scapularis]|uniref:Secreted protein n=1 Tax=Ixodes scapularis TaxID=6945 RepID=B7P6Y1_IXOSC|nr:hypothetical protein IscW_ISCW001148 [Ixodes scapularis]|eukprot:XP_002409361.1 hypothetical protein IscW_ISCW001148 [Ixodes scapularis]
MRTPWRQWRPFGLRRRLVYLVVPAMTTSAAPLSASAAGGQSRRSRPAERSAASLSSRESQPDRRQPRDTDHPSTPVPCAPR